MATAPVVSFHPLRVGVSSFPQSIEHNIRALSIWVESVVIRCKLKLKKLFAHLFFVKFGLFGLPIKKSAAEKTPMVGVW